MSSEQKVRFKRADKSVYHVRREFDEVTDESIASDGGIHENVREAIDDVEAPIDALRERTEEGLLVH